MKKNKSVLNELTGIQYPGPVIKFDLDGRITAANDIAVQTFALNIKEAAQSNQITENISFFSSPEFIKQVLAGGFEINIGDIIYELRIAAPDTKQEVTVFFQDITRFKNEIRQKQSIIKRLKKRIEFLSNQEQLSRDKIARALDTEVGQSLSWLSGKLSSAKQGETQAEPQQNILDEISPILTKTIEDIKNITDDLYPKMLKEMGLNISLRALIDEVSKERRLTAIYQSVQFTDRLPYELEINIYFLIKELLSVIIRWPNLQEFGVKAAKQDKLLTLSVQYSGFDIHQVESEIDMKKIQEGVEVMNGTFSMDTESPSSTTLLIEIPLEGQDGERDD